MDQRSIVNHRPSIGARGSTLALVVISITILSTLGIGLLAVGSGVRRQAIAAKAEIAAVLAAEAGYEKAVFWMTQQQDMLNALQQGLPGTSGSLAFPDGSCSYGISLHSFAGARPVFRVVANGHSGIYNRRVDVLCIQAISGWDMGLCRVPTSSTSTAAVNFATGETLDMPIHINETDDSPDARDISISGSPDFLQPVAMGESRYTAGGGDKYSGVMSLFDGGIYFNQPASRITDESSVQSKVNRFRDSTMAQYRFTPTTSTTALTPRQPAVQLEFFVESGVGKVRITNNCTVKGFRQNSDSKTYDFRIKPGTGGTQYERYDIYCYHVRHENTAAVTVPVTDTYVTQSFGGVDSEPGGQIYIDGNVVIGGNNALHSNDQIVKGKITVVASGNIWVADSIYVEGSHDLDGKPAEDNPNVLGLLAQGVIRIVDPGLSEDPTIPSNHVYLSVCRPDGSDRKLPDPTIVEAAITVGGGGWGAENVKRGSYGGRKEASGSQDYLEVHGTISEAIRGVVSLIGSDGYLKSYHMDRRLLTGIVPGDIWMRGKYVPAPAGWHDYRVAD